MKMLTIPSALVAAGSLLVGMVALGGCRPTPKFEESYPEIIVVQLPDPLSYWELLTEQEQAACLELGKKGRELLFNSDPTVDKTLIRGLDLVRRA